MHANEEGAFVLQHTAELKIQMRFSVRFFFQKIVLLKPFAFFSSHVSPKADVFPTFFDMTEATGFCTSTQDAKISLLLLTHFHD